MKGAGDIINVQYILYGHETSLEDLEEKLDTSITTGLTEKKAKIRLHRFGQNIITTPKPSFWKTYLAPLFDTLITLYLVMTGIMFVLAIFVDGVYEKIYFWIVMVSFNIILAIYQQFRAKKKIDALLKLSPPRAKVIRESKRSEIFADQLVPGDIIELSIGDKIPADARIIRSSNLTINEASLTGESIPVEKKTDGNEIVSVGTPLAKHDNMVYLGTFVQTGSAEAIVLRTGNSTELGKIASAMSEMHNFEIPLRTRVNSLGKKLALMMIVFLIAKISFSIYIRIENDTLNVQGFLVDLVDDIIVAMSVVPINIPLLTTIVLISGVLNMAQKRVVVKNLATIETLGRCSVLCSDKTGTLTTSKMSVKLLWDTKDYFGTTFRGLDYTITKLQENEMEPYLDKGTLKNPPMISIGSGSSLELLLSSAVLNNDAILQFKKDGREITSHADYEVIGDSTDAALLVLALTQGFHDDAMKQRYLKFKDFPFDSAIKRMSGLFRDQEENDYMIYTKGASEVILPLCTRIGDESENYPLTEEKKNEIMQKVNSFADNGYRVISLAYRALDTLPRASDNSSERREIEKDLTFIGFSVIYDPPRPGAREAVGDLDSAGIFPIMITGDSIKTASTIARQVGILDPDEMVVEGRLASTLEDDDFFRVSVFARVSPQDKEIIVSRYQQRGDIVAMTGDGVNDALAITRSDAGVAMGKTGTEVTKEAADLIITDDSYVSLVNGVNEGRNLFEKIRIMVFFYLTLNLAEALLYFSTSFTPGFYLITTWQRIYIFSIIHAFPVLAIIFGPSDRDIMKLKPRANDAIISMRLFFAMLIFSFSYLLVLYGIYLIPYQQILAVTDFNLTGITDNIRINDPEDYISATSMSQAKARTMLVTLMYFLEAIFVFSIRRINKPMRDGTRDANIFVWAMILIGPILHLLVMYVPAIQLKLLEYNIVLDFMPLSFLDMLVVIVLAIIPLGLLEWYKSISRKAGKQF